jgi:hypothetical protein
MNCIAVKRHPIHNAWDLLWDFDDNEPISEDMDFCKNTEAKSKPA